MIKSNQIFLATARWTISVIMVSALTACFTGVESTPKIGISDIKRQNIVDSPEQHYMSDITHEKLDQWHPGKQLLITDHKLAMLLGPEAENGNDLKGTVLTFTGVKNVVSISGDSIASIMFTTQYGLPVKYQMDASIQEVGKRKIVDIPLTIELSIIDEVKQKMLGQTYYVVTRDWYDISNELKQGRRFVQVRIIDVKPGSSFYPVLLVLEDEKGELFHLFMSVGNDGKSPRDFASLFSLTDPRLRYPTITDEAWEHIINGTVKEDMTRDECRLALGSPDNIDRRVGYSVLREIWSYENGKYLIFEDGLLRTYRQ